MPCASRKRPPSLLRCVMCATKNRNGNVVMSRIPSHGILRGRSRGAHNVGAGSHTARVGNSQPRRRVFRTVLVMRSVPRILQGPTVHRCMRLALQEASQAEIDKDVEVVLVASSHAPVGDPRGGIWCPDAKQDSVSSLLGNGQTELLTKGQAHGSNRGGFRQEVSTRS